jgi:thiol reductant ABC exporter CydC subunit
MSVATARTLARASRLQGGEGRRLIGSIGLAFGAVLAATGLLTTSGYLISRAAQRPDILALTAVITAVRGFGLARAALRYAERVVSHDLALRVLARLRAGFYAVLAPLGPDALGAHRRGELLSRFVADVDSLQDLYLRALAPPVVAVLVIISAGAVATLMLPVAALVIAGGLLVAAVAIPVTTALLAAAAGRRQAPARAALASELVEALDGSVELAVAGRGPDRVSRLDRLSARLTWISRRDAAAGAAATSLSSLLTGATIIAVLLVGIPAVHDGAVKGVFLAALVFLVMGAFEGLAPLPLAARSLRGCAEAAGRLEDLAGIVPAVCDPPHPLDAPAGGSLAVHHVMFRYPGQLDDEVLHDVSVTFEPGCRVAITGPSGAGKTTLAHLLVRFLDPSAGAITLGGTDLRELTQDDVRRAIVLAAQDAHVFTTTVRENLSLANRDATEADLWHALEAVQLDRFVRGLPEGLDTLVGEDGDLLSGGERQRLTIARGLVADARFVILDEPTAQLDSDTAEDLIHAVSDAVGDRALIVISHREEGLDGFEEFALGVANAFA